MKSLLGLGVGFLYVSCSYLVFCFLVRDCELVSHSVYSPRVQICQ